MTGSGGDKPTEIPQVSLSTPDDETRLDSTSQEPAHFEGKETRAVEEPRALVAGSGGTGGPDRSDEPLLELPEDRSHLIDHTVNQVMTGSRPSRCGMITRSPEETFELGRRFAERLATGAVFLLNGDLGAGKTVFTKGIAAGLGIDPANITSPTFTLVNVHRGRLPLYHVDLYRLDRASTANVGLEDILEDRNNVSVIEWAERFDYPVHAAFIVTLEYVQETERKISIERG